MSESEAISAVEEPTVKFASSGTGERVGPSDMGATARSEIDTEFDKDAQAQFERVQQMIKGAEAASEEGNSSTTKVFC